MFACSTKMGLRMLLLLLFNVEIYLVYAYEMEHVRAKYGEHCNKTMRCDTSSFLTCKDSVCECQKQETMFYDPVIKSCLALVGEKCRYQLIKGKDELGEMQHHHDQNLILQEELDCVQNAWCNRSGVCMCASDFVELGNGTCISKRNLGETCTSDRECRQDQFLICFNGQCGCNETVATYNILIRQCVGKAGKPCIGNSAGCVYNAECLDKSTFSLGFTKRRMRQSVQICGCNPGFVADNSGFCKVGLGGQCSKTRSCADGFKCRDGQCVCLFENTQLALLRSQTCLSLVGGPCNETIPANDSLLNTNMSSNLTVSTSSESQQQTFQCVDNAFCSLTNDAVYECKCNEGFVVNGDGTCDLAYGSLCNDNPRISMDTGTENIEGSVSRNHGLSCDRTVPLYCINGICECESSLYEYDENLTTCVGKFGARCRIGRKNLVGNITSNGCIPGAECVLSRIARPPSGICTCSEGFTVTSNRMCHES